MEAGGKMDKEKLKYLQTVAEEGNITKAAKRLYISQPALTAFINKVEKKYGVKLFDRNAKPIRLTYAGERFLAMEQQILNLQSRLEEEMEEIAQKRRGRLILGIGNTRGDFWLPHILPKFLKTHPGIEVKIVEGKNDSFEKALRDGSMDLCIQSLPIMSMEIDYEVISEEMILLAVSRNHPILEGKDLRGNSVYHPIVMEPERLNGQKFICPSAGHGLYNCTAYFFEKFSIKPGEMVEINNSDTAFHLASEGLGLVFTPEGSMTPPLPETLPIFCTLETPPYKQKIVGAFNKVIGLSPAAADFIELTRTVVATCPALRAPQSISGEKDSDFDR